MKLIQRWPIKLIQRWPIVQSCTAPHISNKILSSAITHGPINDGRPRSISSFSDCDKGRKRGRLGAVTSILLASVAFPPAQWESSPSKARGSIQSQNPKRWYCIQKEENCRRRRQSFTIPPSAKSYNEQQQCQDFPTTHQRL